MFLLQMLRKSKIIYENLSKRKNLPGHTNNTSFVNGILKIGTSKWKTEGVKKYANKYVIVIT